MESNDSKSKINFMTSEHVLFLLIINKGIKDSYNLVKIFSWKFGIIAFVELVNNLKVEKLIEENNVKGISYYSLTEKGNKYLIDHKEILIPELVKKYPSEKDFVESLY